MGLVGAVDHGVVRVNDLSKARSLQIKTVPSLVKLAAACAQGATLTSVSTVPRNIHVLKYLPMYMAGVCLARKVNP